MMAIDWEGILGDTIYLQEAYDDLVMDAYYRELEYEEQERRALAKNADQAAGGAVPGVRRSRSLFRPREGEPRPGRGRAGLRRFHLHRR